MKFIKALSLILAFSVSSPAIAQSGHMEGMDMGNKNINNKVPITLPNLEIHKAAGVVKAINSRKGTATLAHGPVESLGWPAMTMDFVVKERSFFDKMTIGNKVNIEFIKQGVRYIVTSVK